MGSSAKSSAGPPEGAGEGDPLLLAAGELRGSGGRDRQADLIEERVRPGGGVLDARELHREQDVLARREVAQQLEGLEDEAHAAAAQRGQFVLVHRRERRAVDRHVPAVGRSRPTELGWRRLAAPEGPTMQTNSPASTERSAVEDGEVAAARAQAPGEAGGLEERAAELMVIAGWGSRAGRGARREILPLRGPGTHAIRVRDGFIRTRRGRIHGGTSGDPAEGRSGPCAATDPVGGSSSRGPGDPPDDSTSSSC